MPSILNRSLFGGKAFSSGSQSRKGRNNASIVPTETDENLDLFSKNRQSHAFASSDESADAVSVQLRRLSLESGKAMKMKSALDDLIASPEKEKHDYDWLLTPPGTPPVPLSDGNKSQATLEPPRKSLLVRSRSVSTSKASRLSVTQPESKPPSRLERSSSVARSSSAVSQLSAYSSLMSSSVLSTSSASVSSYSRPYSATQSISTPRPSSFTGRTMVSRSTTPSKSASTDKALPSRISVSHTPSPRLQIPASAPSCRSNSRASTPTRRASAASVSPVSSFMAFTPRPTLNGRISASGSHPSSPGPRLKTPPQIVLHHDFPNDRPPNLRTSLPDGGTSSGRSRPGLAKMRVVNSDSTCSLNVPSRQSSPTAARGRSSGNHVHSNERILAEMPVARKVPLIPESAMRRPVKPCTAGTALENNGFRRSMSRNSLDLAVRRTDKKHGMGGRVHPVSGSSMSILIPQSQSSAGHAALRSSQGCGTSNYCDSNRVKLDSKNGHHAMESQDHEVFESYCRNDASFLEEDDLLKSTNWLHSLDDSSNMESDYYGLIFDNNGLDLLPEPFGPF